MLMEPTGSWSSHHSSATNADVAIRHEEILDQPPRIPPLPASEIGADGLAIVRALRVAAGLPEGGGVPEMVATLLRHPGLYERHAALGTELLGHGALAARHRELAILRTGWLCRAPFEWGEHVAIAGRAGLDAEEIDRVTRGSRAEGWNDHDRAILEATEELHDGAMISNAAWASLTTFLDDRQLIELVYVVGHYTKVAYMQNALRLRLADGNAGLFAR